MESIISQIESKIKFLDLAQLRVFVENFFWGILVILLLTLSFFLGRLTKFMENTPEFTFESAPDNLQYQTEKNNLFGQASVVSTSTIVASSGGKKYYFLWCKGAANIKENKKRFFATEEAAQKAGYTLANACK